MRGRNKPRAKHPRRWRARGLTSELQTKWKLRLPWLPLRAASLRPSVSLGSVRCYTGNPRHCTPPPRHARKTGCCPGTPWEVMRTFSTLKWYCFHTRVHGLKLIRFYTLSVFSVLCFNYTSLKLKKEIKKNGMFSSIRQGPSAVSLHVGFFLSAFRPQVVSVVKTWYKEVWAKLAQTGFLPTLRLLTPVSCSICIRKPVTSRSFLCLIGMPRSQSSL